MMQPRRWDPDDLPAVPVADRRPDRRVYADGRTGHLWPANIHPISPSAFRDLEHAAEAAAWGLAGAS